MHASPASAGAPGLSAEEFGHEFSWWHPFRECMSMSAMRTEDDVLVPQMSTNRTGNRLLADIGVARTLNQAPLMAAGQLFLGLADSLHRAVEIEVGLACLRICHE